MKSTQQSICPFCSMGCSLLVRPGAGTAYVGPEGVPALDYDANGRVNRGSLCAKGNMSLELMMHTSRLDVPQIRQDGDLRPTSWDEAVGTLVERLQRICRDDGPAAIGLLAGSRLSNEEAFLAAELARTIGTPHLDLCQPEDHVILGGLARAGARPEPVTSIEEIDAMTAVLVVGDAFTLAPCIAKPVLNARYDRRRNVLGVLGFWKSRTVLFGRPVLHCLPGRESAALALLLKMALEDTGGRSVPWRAEARMVLDSMTLAALADLAGVSMDDATRVLEALRTEEKSGVLVGCGFAETERLDLAAGLSALLAEATGSRFLTLLTGPNSRGVHASLRKAGFPGPGGLTAAEMLEAAGTGDLKAILSFGCDPLAAMPGQTADTASEKLDLQVVTSPMPGVTSQVADVVLPCATWGEKAGTVLGAFGFEADLHAVLPPPGAARPGATILADIRDRLAISGETARPPSDEPVRGPIGSAASFFDEIDIYVRLEQREMTGREVGTHVLLPEFAPSHSGDGLLTRHLSWPHYELPAPLITLSAGHAADLGVKDGDEVRVRSRDAEALLTVRVEKNLPAGVVLAPPHFPDVRRLTVWLLDPALRDLDLRPGRVSVERVSENDR